MFSVGEIFWTSFFTIIDIESVYPDPADYFLFLEAENSAILEETTVPLMPEPALDVISLAYTATSSLPDVDTFFRASTVGSDCRDYEIRSGEFTEEHVGSHTLNVTVADLEGGQVSFQIAFSVSSEAVTSY